MQKLKILIVEDESLIALYLQKKLAQQGYDVCMLAARGEDAVVCAQRENPDVVLMDIQIEGDIDGIETAHQIGSFSQAKIVFITGQSDPEIRKRAQALKPAAFLTKPVKIHDIQSILQQLG